MKALTLEHLSFAYLPEQPIFRQLSCTLARCAEGEGRVVALMGASGAGKSTLLKLILQTLKPDQRELVVDYYRDAQRQRIDRRRDLAAKLGITMNALGIRACRIRGTLETCVGTCCKTR